MRLPWLGTGIHRASANASLVRETAVAILEGHDYRGMVGNAELWAQPAETWGSTLVADVARKDWPVANPGWSVEQAVGAMDGADVDALPVLADDGTFVGLVTISDIIRLDEILESDSET
jgi:CBS domain-containing protein